jgi:hypothetical protein
MRFVNAGRQGKWLNAEFLRARGLVTHTRPYLADVGDIGGPVQF